jgi:hypothetical protein
MMIMVEEGSGYHCYYYCYYGRTWRGAESYADAAAAAAAAITTTTTAG